MATKGESGVIYTNDTAVQARGMKIDNPFSFKVGQVFTGFGIGCGIGIGVGRPLNLGAIPVLNQVMMATRGATDAFSGIQIHVNNSLRKMGAKNIEAGIGCGVGFGHGFGVGIAIKPSLLHQIQSHISQAATHMMRKLGIGSHSPLSVNQGILPASIHSGMSAGKETSNQNPAGSNPRDGQTVLSSSDTLSPKSAALDPQYSSRTETVLNNFLKSSFLQEEGRSLHKHVKMNLYIAIFASFSGLKAFYKLPTFTCYAADKKQIAIIHAILIWFCSCSKSLILFIDKPYLTSLAIDKMEKDKFLYYKQFQLS